MVQRKEEDHMERMDLPLVQVGDHVIYPDDRKKIDVIFFAIITGVIAALVLAAYVIVN